MSRKLLTAVLLLGLVGCTLKKEAASESARAHKEAKGKEAQDKALQNVDLGLEDRAARAPAVEAKDKPAPAGKPTPRKIVYTARIAIVAEDLDRAEAKLLRFLEERKGYVTHSQSDNQPWAPRSATWTVRVPAERFRGLLAALPDLGEVQNNKVDAQDVTEQYFDTEEDAKNKEAREKALRELYKQKIVGSKLEDLMAVDREIYSVRGEINKARGQLKRWDKDVAYSTVTIAFSTRKDEPPPPTAFGELVSGTFNDSVEALVWVGKALVLAVVAMGPWLAILGVLGGPALLVHRVLRRRRPLAAASPDEVA